MVVSDWILLARLVRPQGRRGELLADLLTDFPERFAERTRVFLRVPAHAGSATGPGAVIESRPITEPRPLPEPRAVEVESHWLHKGRVVLKFAGIDSINDAELLRGMEVVIAPQHRAALSEDEVYIDDLLGCVVYEEKAGDETAGNESAGNERAGNQGTENGRVGEERTGLLLEVGPIVDVDMESTSGALLVVKRTNGEEVLIPFVKAYLRRVDVANKRIEMNLPEGLLEVNAPLDDRQRRVCELERAAPADQLRTEE